MAGRRRASAVALVATAALALAACGGGGSSSTPPTTTTAVAPAKAGKPSGDSGSGGSAKVPKKKHSKQGSEGGGGAAEGVRKTFPKPQADPEVEGSAAAIAAGEAACEGKTPAQIKAAFYDQAIEEGTLEPMSPEGKMIARLGAVEKQAGGGTSFAAGQLAADVYAATLPEETATYGFRGCTHALALTHAAELESGR